MRRKVIGYDKTIEYLKKGYQIIKFPMYANEYIFDEANNEYITIRNDVWKKIFLNNIKLTQVQTTMDNWSICYRLKEE